MPQTAESQKVGTQTQNLPRKEWQRFVRVFFYRRSVIFGLIVLFLLVFCALFADFLAPYDPYEQNLSNVLSEPSLSHWLGTDSIGRDTLSRIIYGSRTAIVVGFVSVAISSSIGIMLGIFAGYFGGIINMIIMRTTDVIMPFPMIVLALLISALLGGGLHNVILALGIATTPSYIRIVCGMTLAIKENEYVLAEHSMGASHLRIMTCHILPNAFAPIIIVITMQLGFLILSEATLSFLGIGIEPPGAAWGAMVNEGYRYLLRTPILAFAPGFAIMLVVYAFNLVGDALRDALDPRLKGIL